jgi:ABC-type dipeptide/oligopeptide/nickel transport system permease subunit
MIASLLSPTWSNDKTAPHILFFPAPFLSVTVLAVNLLGDGLRDHASDGSTERLLSFSAIQQSFPFGSST